MALADLKETFNTDRFVYCFDKGEPYRAQILPTYKGSRAKKYDADPKMLEARQQVRDALVDLRRKWLPQIGAFNVLHQKGYEADDMIASVCIASEYRGQEKIIVSADSDLYQLLRLDVKIYNPRTRKILTDYMFVRKYGIRPSQWDRVKAIAGCSTDSIPGIRGVGEATAIKWLKGELKRDSVKYRAINSDEQQLDPADRVVRRNLLLTSLPYQGANHFDLEEDAYSIKGWKDMCAELGFRSLVNNPPFFHRERRKVL